MENNNELEVNKTNNKRPTPFLKRVTDLERRVNLIEKRLKTIILSLSTRR